MNEDIKEANPMRQSLSKEQQEFMMQMFIDYEEAMKRRLDARTDLAFKAITETQNQIIIGFSDLVEKKEAMEAILNEMRDKEQKLAAAYENLRIYMSHIDSFMSELERRINIDSPYIKH